MVLVAMMAAAGLALRQLGRLDVNPHPISQLDDLLLFACLPSFFIYGIASLVPALAYSNYTSLVITILQVIIILIAYAQFSKSDANYEYATFNSGVSSDSANAFNNRRFATVQQQSD